MSWRADALRHADPAKLREELKKPRTPDGRVILGPAGFPLRADEYASMTNGLTKSQVEELDLSAAEGRERLALLLEQSANKVIRFYRLPDIVQCGNSWKALVMWGVPCAELPVESIPTDVVYAEQRNRS